MRFSRTRRQCGRGRTGPSWEANWTAPGGFWIALKRGPLTDEQRRAVVVDDDRNLVVAAAGSGKTSVMVAKAGWVVERGDRRPEELLLLAFQRDARDELAERVEKRLGGQAGQDMDVRTFHSLGLSIIGEAEGRRPALAKTATTTWRCSTC